MYVQHLKFLDIKVKFNIRSNVFPYSFPVMIRVLFKGCGGGGICHMVLITLLKIDELAEETDLEIDGGFYSIPSAR